MKIIVLGGDGFCGWPTSLHLSNIGHDVLIVDNLSRRNIDNELCAESLTPISSIGERLKTWKNISQRDIGFSFIDIAIDYEELLALITRENPDVIVHFAEQRAAPYSMKSSKHKRYTVNNNLNATHNVLAAIVESGLDIHLIHLGTMGVYGYGTAGMKIPEGYLNVELKTEGGQCIQKEILYPANPGSIYHMTKTQDQLFFHFYNKNDNIRITDLHQGIVWGTHTAETQLDEKLINRFDYDGDYGTVLNRFIVQSVIGMALTVNGTGGQTRAFIHIQDTVRCIELALRTPPLKYERVKIYNQMTETHRVIDLAMMVSSMTGVEINYVQNPRNESDSNDLWVENRCLIDLGLTPIVLKAGLMIDIADVAKKYKSRILADKIPSASYWSRRGPDNIQSTNDKK